VSVFAATVPLRGTLRAANGEVVGRQVMLRVARPTSWGGVAFERSTLAFTRPDGTWTVPGLPAGRYIVGVSVFDAPSPSTPYPTVWYPDAARPEDATVLDVTDESTVSIDFRLPARIPEMTLTGRTVSADGTPIAGVDLSLHDVDAHPLRDRVESATSDESGRFSIVGLRGRRYRIRWNQYRRDGASSNVVDVTDEAIRDGLAITVKP
jgi:hypothetical protein